MGIIMSALAASGDAGVQSMNQNIEQQNKFDLQKHLQDLETAKAKEIAQFNNQLAIDTANQQRQVQTERIGAAQTGIINSTLTKKYGGSDAAVAAADAGQTDAPLSDDQRAVIEQAKQRDIDTLKGDNDTYVKAAIQTGDIKPEKVADLANKAEIASMKAENYQNRTEMMQKLGDMKTDAMRYGYELRLQAAQEKASTGKISASLLTMQVNSLNADIKSSQGMIGIYSRQMETAGKGEKAGLQARIDELNSDIKQSKLTKQAYISQLADIGAIPKAAGAAQKPDADNNSGDLDTLFPVKK